MIWGFPKIGIPPVIIQFRLGFALTKTIHWGISIYGNPHLGNGSWHCSTHVHQLSQCSSLSRLLKFLPGGDWPSKAARCGICDCSNLPKDAKKGGQLKNRPVSYILFLLIPSFSFGFAIFWHILPWHPILLSPENLDHHPHESLVEHVGSTRLRIPCLGLQYDRRMWPFGAFHSHGGTPNWMVFVRENPNLNWHWMMTGGWGYPHVRKPPFGLSISWQKNKPKVGTAAWFFYVTSRHPAHWSICEGLFKNPTWKWINSWKYMKISLP